MRASAKHCNLKNKSEDHSCDPEECLPDNLLDNLQISLIFFDEEGNIYRTNKMARKDLLLAENKKVCKLADLLSIDYRGNDILPELCSRLDIAESGQVPLPRDAFISTKDGNAAFFAAGNFSRLCGNRFLLAFRNIMDEVMQEYMIKMALSTSSIFPWFFDMKKGKMVIDARYFDYTGIPTKDYTMTVEEYIDRLHPEDRAFVSNVFTLHLNGEHYPYPVPFRLRRGDDSYEWFAAQSTYLGQLKNLPFRIVGICMSTQAHKDIEETLIKARDRAEQSDKLKSAFLANMSHEIRTPLNAIVGFSTLLTGGEIDPHSNDAKEYVALISKNCDYLLSLVSDMLDLSRIESGTMEYVLSEYSLNRFFKEIYEKYACRFPADIKLNLQLPSCDIRIITDPLRLGQVVGHLIDNAIKFTTEGQIDMGYTLSGDGRYVRLYISDTGCGIPSGQTSKIFERFYKVDSFVQGAGLGLSLCKIITERLGGQISVSSLLKRGSRFTLKFPLDPRAGD